MFGGVPTAPVGAQRREDLRHRARLLVGRAAGGRLRELRLRVRARVAPLLLGAEPAVVALADRHHAGAEREDGELARAGRPAAAARVEQAAVAGPLAAVAAVLARGERRRAVRERGEAGHELAVDVQLGLHRVGADPVLLVRLDVARVVERVRVGALGLASTRRPRSAPRGRRRAPRPRRRPPSGPPTAPCRRSRTARGCSRRRCRASPRPCRAARRCRCPRASRPGPRRAACARTRGCAA